MKLLFLNMETTIKIKMHRILEKLSHCHNQRQQVRSFDINVADCENCLHSFPANTEKPIVWSPGVSGRFLFCFINVWLQQCKIWSKDNQTIVVTHSWYRTRYWTYCYQKNKPVYLVHIRWYSAVGYYEFSWRRNESSFLLKAYKTSRAKNFFA